MKLNSQVGRAALLRAFKAHEGDAAQKVELAALMGFAPSDTALAIASDELPKAGKPTDKTGGGGKDKTPPLKPPPTRPQVTYYYLDYHERYTTEEQAKQDQPECLRDVNAVSDDDLTGFWDQQEPLAPRSLVQAKPMTPILRRQLKQEVGRRLDVKTLVKKVARQQRLYQLPTQARIVPAGRVTVIADINQRVRPFWEDIEQACELIRQKHGKIGLDMRVLAHDEPRKPYYDYEDWQKQELPPKPWARIPAQSLVVLISDLGQLSAENSLIRKRWLTFIQQLNRRGIKPLVLCPIAPEQQSRDIQRGTRQLLWHRFGRLKQQTHTGNAEAQLQRVTTVVSCLSLSPHIEPELLRALCELLPVHEANTGVEAEVYLHPHVQFGLTSVTLRPEYRAHYQQHFAALPEAFKKQTFATIERHHSEQFAAVWAETILNAERLMSVDSAMVKKAEQWMLSFSQRYYQESNHDGMMRFARRHLSRLSEMQQKNKPYASALFGLAFRQEIKAGKAIPEYLDTGIVNQMVREHRALQEYTIRQIGTHLVISTETDEALQQQGKVGQILATFKSLQSTVVVNQQTLSLPVQAYPLSDKTDVDTGQERFTICGLKKPSWASSMVLENNTLFATLQFAGESVYFKPEPKETPQQSVNWDRYTGTSTIAFDEIGLYADMPVSGVIQRFRYIEPGTFLMGSAENEDGRTQNEDQHQVTLTQGYWMADTACTQQLWQAVMGKNPSDFKGDLSNPVENVSWLDIQTFISKLKAQYPQLKIQLPSEAQWEYACRAETSTPFNFEGDISLDKVNYRGLWGLEKDENDNYKWHDEARQKTVPVKSFPANRWGLHEMHGNVWEWCFDEWKDNLGHEPQVNPVEAAFLSGVKPDQPGNRTADPHVFESAMLENADDAKVLRVLRGGSWGGDGRGCRSAIRGGNVADDRLRYGGFRFSLGLELQSSTASRSDTVSSSEQTEPAIARRGAAQGLDQAASGSPSGMLGKIKNWLGDKNEN